MFLCNTRQLGRERPLGIVECDVLGRQIDRERSLGIVETFWDVGKSERGRSLGIVGSDVQGRRTEGSPNCRLNPLVLGYSYTKHNVKQQ